jgi:hypothetical protein
LSWAPRKARWSSRMSANGATDQRSSFQRWVASLKRESQPDGPSAVPTVLGVRPKRDDDATRVHRVPKDILLHLQARAAAGPVESLHAERTAVFRAPPELLERARRLGPADRGDPAAAAEEELTQPPVPGSSSAPDASAESSTILDFQDSTESTSGISQRPQGLGPRAQAEAEAVLTSAVPAESREPATPPAPSPPAPPSLAPSSPAPSSPARAPLNDDSTRSWPVPVARAALHADVDALLSSARPLLAKEPQSTLDSSDRASVPPQFRQRSWPTLLLIALLAVAAVWFVLTQR